ncbi:DNA polymerase [Testudinibacter sp. P80/BLE/0925]|uniref:DNA polymerase n=1 Tax=Testudinibacter sp. TW-1 TaxID=3417757 RepID=UPI003D360BAE
MPILYADLETYSDIPIRNGVHAYAENVEILLFAYALDDGEVQVWDATAEPMPSDLKQYLADPTITLMFHNSHFDRTVLRHALPTVDFRIQRFLDTMIIAYLHSLPGALAELCEVFGVPTDKAKDKAGKQLIQLFCKPLGKNRKLDRATRHTHPEEWLRFKAYARLDIIAMREVHKRLPTWNLIAGELALWQLDQKINDRGVAVDRTLAEAAIRAVTKEQAELRQQAQTMTDGTVHSTTQRDALLDHILQQYGVELPDLTASTIERRLDDPELPEPVKELLRNRLNSSGTATAKYRRLLQAVNSDGRLRGMLQFCGAGRTGRWAGRIFQPQNLPRPSMNQDDIDFGITALKADAADLIFDNVTELASSALRGCLIAPQGKKLVVSDLSNIEGRMLIWLAGEKWKLQAFRDFDKGSGHDLYKLAYAKSFRMNPEKVTKAQRQIGKVMELGLGYGGGVGAFLNFALVYKLDLDELADNAFDSINPDILAQAKSAWHWASDQKRTYDLSERVYIACDALKRLWREAHPQTVKLWSEVESAVRNAITQSDKVFRYRDLAFLRTKNWLRIRLPSGRQLCYPSIAIEDGKITYFGLNTYSRKWGRIATYSGKLTENITQAAARDVMANNMQLIENSGYQIVLTVHDEVLTEAPDTVAYTPETLSRLLATNPLWAQDLPLNAGGFEAYRYKKD